MRILVLLLAGSLLTSCATVFGSRTNTLRFDETIPPQSTVMIDGADFGSPEDGKLKIPATVVQDHSNIQVVSPTGEVLIADTLYRKVDPVFFILDFTFPAVSHSVDFMSGNIFRPHPRNFSTAP